MSVVDYKVVKSDCCLQSQDVSDRLKDINLEYYKNTGVMVISMKEVDAKGIDVNEFAKKLKERLENKLGK